MKYVWAVVMSLMLYGHLQEQTVAGSFCRLLIFTFAIQGLLAAWAKVERLGRSYYKTGD